VKTIKKSNFRVEVYPKMTVYGFLVAEEEDACDAMLADINRHVNDVQCAYVVSDNDPVCESCGCQWTEDGDTYNGGCCKSDQDAEDARPANATDHFQSRSEAEDL
jgi:hypothetical protein